MSEPGIFEIINTTRFGEIYERVRPLIVWLGLRELAFGGGRAGNPRQSNRYNRHELDGMGFQSANKVNLKESKS